MGQKSNTLTLRTYKERLDLRSTNSKETLDLIESINVLKRSFDKKGIIIAYHTINTMSQTCYLTLNVFYKTERLLKFRKIIRLSLKKLKKNAKKNKILTTQLFNKTFANKLLILNMVLLNKSINKKILKFLYNDFKSFKNMLFSRRFNLFIDFLKLTSLFVEQKIDIKVYLPVLGRIFKILPKRMHSKFFFFLKHLIKVLIDKTNIDTKVKGVHVVINGKLKGKLRSSTLKMLVGKIGTQTISSKIDFSKLHVFTMYGTFGFKMWVNYI